MSCFICLESNYTNMKRLKCCRKCCHAECLQKWLKFNKFNKYQEEEISCPCCRRNIRDNLFKPLELHNMPYTFYMQYDKSEESIESESDSDENDDDAYESTDDVYDSDNEDYI